MSCSVRLEQGHHVLFKAGSPSRRITMGTYGLGANSIGEFTVKGREISALQTNATGAASQMVPSPKSITADVTLIQGSNTLPFPLEITPED